MNTVLRLCPSLNLRLSGAMRSLVFRTAFYFVIYSIRQGNTLPLVPTHGMFLKEFFSKLQQPASLEVWTVPSCAENFEVSVMARTLAGTNLSIAYHGVLEGRNFYCYLQRATFGKSPCNTPRYVWMDVCQTSELAIELQTFLHLCSNTNFIVSTRSVLKVTSAHRSFCSTIQLVWSPEDNAADVGFPVRSVTDSGCSKWQFYNQAAAKAFYPGRFPWLRYTAAPAPGLKNAVLKGRCLPNCTISSTLILLSEIYNFTILDCFCEYRCCDFFESFMNRVSIGIVLAGVGRAMNTMKSHGLAFLAPKGALRPTWEYVSHTSTLGAWIGFLLSFTTMFFFIVMIFKRQRSSSVSAPIPLWRVAEFLFCSIFASTPIPRTCGVVGALLLTWTMVMQVPACGFRAIITSCLNVPPRKDPISGPSELSKILGDDSDSMSLCVEDTSYSTLFAELYRNDVSDLVDPHYKNPKMTQENHESLKRFWKVVSSKLRYFDCYEYVRNGTGVFFGFESDIRGNAGADMKITSNQFTRLEYVPHIAVSNFHSHYRRPLLKALLQLFETQIEPHLNTMRYIKEKRKFKRVSEAYPVPHSVKNLWPYIQMWLVGLLVASAVLLTEYGFSRREIILT